MKTYSFLALLLLVVLLVVAIIALAENSLRLSRDLVKSRRDSWRDLNRVSLLQVQLMDRVLIDQDGRQLDKLLDNPKEWLAPLMEMINNDAKLASLLKSIAIEPSNSNDANEYLIYCNPVNQDPEPYEAFTLKFSGDKCIGIRRTALCPW